MKLLKSEENFFLISTTSGWFWYDSTIFCTINFYLLALENQTMALCLQDYGNRSMDKFNGTDLPGGMRKR